MLPAAGTFVEMIFGARWLGLSVVCCALLLGALFLVSGPFPATAAATIDQNVKNRDATPGSAGFDKATGDQTKPGKAAIPEIAAQSSTLTFITSTYVVSEGDGSGQIVLHVDPPSPVPVTFTVSSANIQAEAGMDFVGLREFLVITPSEPAYTLMFTILDDQWVEGSEQLRLTLGNYQGVSPGVITETVVTIEDNDVAYLGISDVVVDEDAGSVALHITQSLTSTLQSVVDVQTIEGSATSPEDFEALATTVVISPGSTEAMVIVPIQDDAEIEADESFDLLLENPTNALLADATATVTILDNDGFPEIQVASTEAVERRGFLRFVLTLSSTWAQTVTVEYATVDGTAMALRDYLTSEGVVTIPPGEMAATVDVTLIVDDVEEADETLFLFLTNPVQALLGNNEIEGIIRDGAALQLYLPGLAH